MRAILLVRRFHSTHKYHNLHLPEREERERMRGRESEEREREGTFCSSILWIGLMGVRSPRGESTSEERERESERERERQRERQRETESV